MQCASTVSVLCQYAPLCVTDQGILHKVTATVEADDDSCHQHQLVVCPLAQETGEGEMEDIYIYTFNRQMRIVEDIFLL